MTALTALGDHAIVITMTYVKVKQNAPRRQLRIGGAGPCGDDFFI